MDLVFHRSDAKIGEIKKPLVKLIILSLLLFCSDAAAVDDVRVGTFSTSSWCLSINDDRYGCLKVLSIQ